MTAATRAEAAQRWARDEELFAEVAVDRLEPDDEAPEVPVDVVNVGAMSLGEALQLAEQWRSRGVPVFPLRILSDAEKLHTNKVPLTEHGHKDGTTDERQMRLLFNKARGRPGEALGVGLWLGPAGYFAVDLDGDANVAVFDQRELAPTFSVTTCSGGRHAVYRKREPVHVGTRCDWPEVDVVRSDDGFVVAPGTFTPWGEWVSHDDWPGDVETAPPELWAVIDRRAPGAQRSSGGVMDRGLDRVLARLDADGRDQDANALRVLCDAHGGHHPFLDAAGGLYVTRPGKQAGTSASIGYVAPGVVKVFTTNWAPFTDGRRYVAEGDQLVDASPEPQAHNGEPSVVPTPPPHVDPDTGEILTTNLADEFWAARPVLAHIRQAARSRLLPADAVLGSVLARIATLVPPNVRLPAPVGAPGTLDLLIALIGPPGAGKSSSAQTARELLPTSRRDIIDGLPLGSGEGIAEAYLGPPEQITDTDGTVRKIRRQTISAILAYVDEGEALAQMASRKGSTLLTTLRTAWSGGTLGQSNASQDTHRVVHEGRYRFAGIIAWQPVHAAAILDDTGGTPERIVWLSAVDPTIPDIPPEWPGPINWAPPPTMGAGVTIDVPREIVAELRAAHLVRARGESVTGGDGHEGLGRLKIAAVLGQLDGRDRMSVEDWALAGQVMTASTRVRASIASVARTAAVVREQATTERAIRQATALADSAETRALDRAACAVGRYAHRHGVDGPVTRRQLTRAVAGRDAALVDGERVLALALERDWITVEGDGYRPGKARPA